MKRHNETPQKTKDQDQTQLLNPMDEWWHLNQVQVWNIHRGQRLVQRGSFWCLWWPWWLPGAVPLWFAVMAFLHFFQVAKFCERSCLNMFVGNGNIDVPCISHLVVWFFEFCNARLQVTYLKLSHPGMVWRCEDMWSAKGSKGRKVKVFLFFASRPSSNIVGFSEAVEKENSNEASSRPGHCYVWSSWGARRDDGTMHMFHVRSSHVPTFRVLFRNMEQRHCRKITKIFFSFCGGFKRFWEETVLDNNHTQHISTPNRGFRLFPDCWVC